jgi:hypothetical protein
MFLPKSFFALWIAAFSLLAISMALHTYEDFERIAHSEHHDHRGSSDNASPDEEGHSHFGSEHSHGVADLSIISFHSSLVCMVRAFAPAIISPESPFAKIDYPPKLS